MNIQFAYWATNLGGLVFSQVPQNTDWTFNYNAQLAQIAEQVGFDYALIAARFMLTHGRSDHLESLSTTAGLAAVTQRLKLIAAVHPGLREFDGLEKGKRKAETGFGELRSQQMDSIARAPGHHPDFL